MELGDLSPLFFNPRKDKFLHDINYLQKFYVTDKILLQVIGSLDETPEIYLNDLFGSTKILYPKYYTLAGEKITYVYISNLPDSIYTVTVKLPDAITSEPFEVFSDTRILNETCLIKYTHKNNDSTFSDIFWTAGMQHFYQLRLEGGFKPGGISFNVNNEQFRTQTQGIKELYSVPYNKLVFTIGNAGGVPYWFGELVNRLFCVSHVYIDDKRYIRSESSTPQIQNIMEDMQTFNYTISVEESEYDSKVNDIEKEGLILRNISNSLFRKAGDKQRRV